jgi:hypothetical protein
MKKIIYISSLLILSLAGCEKSLDLTPKDQLSDASFWKKQDWKFRLDLWQNPWVIARYYNLKPWSEEHKLLLKKHLKLY